VFHPAPLVLTRRIAYWLPPLLYAAFIFHVSSQSDPFPTIAPLFWDKAVHGSEYAVLALLTCRALRSERLPWAAAIPVTILLVSAYGGSDEWHQMFVPMRSSDPMDWVADTVGSALGCLVYWSICARWLGRKSPDPERRSGGS
jgi:VanZ family protein